MHGDPRAEAAAVDRIRRSETVQDMQRAARQGGVAPVLRWLAAHTGAEVFLMDSAGAVTRPSQAPLGSAEQGVALRGVREAAVRGLGSLVIEQGGLTCVVLPLDGSRGGRVPFVAAVATRPAPPGLQLLLADAAPVLSWSWLAESTRRQQGRVRRADARTREAVLHLLMNGHISAARQVAGALRPALPVTVRVYVIEGPPQARAGVVEELTEVADTAWIVPCPVYADHTLMLAPADDALERVLLPERTAACRIGVSLAVPLRDTATGYGQAFHALAVARERSERQSSFADSPDLVLAMGPAAAMWAEAFLAPIQAHRAKRPQDPDSAELLATAASWLSFRSRATAHLKIHRNTLSGRLICVQELLGLNLGGLADQAALALALRATATRFPPRPDHDAAGADKAAPTLDELLALPAVLGWAQRQLRPVLAPGVPPFIAQTLATWLTLDARVGPTADALSISASALRKRLTRSEVLLERSLLRSPSAVHDYWLAHRALELTGRSPRSEPGAERR